MKSLKEVFEEMAKRMEKNPGITGFVIVKKGKEYKVEVKGGK